MGEAGANEGDDRSADFDAQGASTRPGGAAKPGLDADAASVRAADAASAEARRKMRDEGFGDHKGGDIS